MHAANFAFNGFRLTQKTVLNLIIDDITEWVGDAIVNAGELAYRYSLL